MGFSPPPPRHRWLRPLRRLAFLLVFVFLLANLAGRALTLYARGAEWTAFAVVVALAGWPVSGEAAEKGVDRCIVVDGQVLGAILDIETWTEKG